MEDRSDKGMNPSKASLILQNIKSRIKMLTSADKMPDDAKKQLQREVAALEFALNCIQANTTSMVIITGHKAFVEKICEGIEKCNELERLAKNTNQEADLTCLMILEPSKEMMETCLKLVNPDGREGKKLRDDAIIGKMGCNRYFAATNNDDKLLLFDVIVDKDYYLMDDTNEVVERISNLRKWAIAIFKNMNWN